MLLMMELMMGGSYFTFLSISPTDFALLSQQIVLIPYVILRPFAKKLSNFLDFSHFGLNIILNDLNQHHRWRCSKGRLRYLPDDVVIIKVIYNGLGGVAKFK